MANSQCPLAAVSPPRSGASLSFINDYGASIVTPIILSHSTRDDEKDVENSPLFGDLEDLRTLEILGISATTLKALTSQGEFPADLNNVVSSASTELKGLEERKTDTLSFEELLVHADALYKSNENGVCKLGLQSQPYGYTPVEASNRIHVEVVEAMDVSKRIHGEFDEDPSHQEIMANSQCPLAAVSPPRSGASLSFINDYGASTVTPIILSHSTRDDEKDVENSPLFGDLGDLGNLESLGILATTLKALANQDEPEKGSGSVDPVHQKLTSAESPSMPDSKPSSNWRMTEDSLMSKYSSAWNSEAEKKLPPGPNIPTTKVGSNHGTDERHLGAIVFDKPVTDDGVGIKPTSDSGIGSKALREDGIGATESVPTSTIFKRDLSLQTLETKKDVFLDEVTSAQYDSSPLWLKLHVSMQELNSIVSKINELIRQRGMGGQHANQFVLDQDDVQALGGSKACMLLLGMTDKVVPQISNGAKAYRIRV